MKTVFLLRHAKSAWDDPALPDIQRPLAPRGRKAAPAMGAYLARKALFPDLVLCSPARRARETWELLGGTMGGEVPVEVREGLYHAGPQELLAMLRQLPGAVESVLAVGHNPTLEETADLLVGSGEGRALKAMGRKFSTGALAILDFPVERWREVTEGTAYLRAFLRPKDLK